MKRGQSQGYFISIYIPGSLNLTLQYKKGWASNYCCIIHSHSMISIVIGSSIHNFQANQVRRILEPHDQNYAVRNKPQIFLGKAKVIS